ncbi:Protein of unknown function DUF58 [Prosthecobacter debontii]|uniref:DUF58 domain-containing protein n=1 Tax=Prosthecobacter debontii TaxID=48467 RepID=A0A1T4WFV2_9BACT|nr:DUF58 domain-containing protein [Prosthecobacter debontii]SKA76216.1 Protein of unknown function DUF58 [Prosthecobacter debontii]
MRATLNTDEWRALLIQAREWARVLKLPFRRQRWRGQSGEFQGTGVGSSLDFQDHRAYIPGDDPRQINWQAYARTGTYTMKLYREEVRPLVDLVVDVSPSMAAFPAKGQRVQELVAYALEASLQAGAAVRCFCINGADHRHVELEAMLAGRWQEEWVGLTKSKAEMPPALSRVPWRAGALRLCISDLLFPTEPEHLLLPLSQNKGRGIVFAPAAAEEANPDWDGNYEFEDAETTTLHERRVEPDLLQRYLQAYTRHFELWKGAAIKHGVALAPVSAEGDFLTALRREGMPSGAVETA